MENVKIYRCIVVKAALVDVTATASGIDTVKRYRKRAAEGLQKQAEKMTVVSCKKVAKPLVGQNVRVKVPDVDWAKVDPKSIIAVVLNIENDDFYQLGTTTGKLIYTRNQFTLCTENCCLLYTSTNSFFSSVFY